MQNDYGSEEAKKVGEELIEKERVTGLSDSAQVGGPVSQSVRQSARVCMCGCARWRGAGEGSKRGKEEGQQAGCLAGRQLPLPLRGWQLDIAGYVQHQMR